MEVWPVSLPYHAERDGFNGEPFQEPMRTEMDDGAVRRRRRSTLNIARISFAIEFTSAQFAIFKPWVRDTLVDGTLSFEMPVWTGSEYAVKICSFAQPYGFVPLNGVRVVISLVLDIEDY